MWGAGGVHGSKGHLEILRGEQGIFLGVRSCGRTCELKTMGKKCRGETQSAEWGILAREQEEHRTHFVGSHVRNTCGVFPLPFEWDGCCVGVFLLLAENCSPQRHSLGRAGHFPECIFADSTTRKQFVEDFIALVRGGASEEITMLAHKDLPTAQLMQKWGDAVQYNPEIIKLKVLHPPLPPASAECLGELCV